MRIVAILAVRNEVLYLRRCLTHLASQQVESCIIDNSSTDGTIEIAESFLKQGVFKIVRLPYPGYYDWSGLLKAKENLSHEINADWFIHCDADEIREAPKFFKNLSDGIIEVDSQGYNAINFDEFVFLPTSDEDCFEGTDYVALMRYYYFFKPAPLRRINAWKKSIYPVDLVSSGGHAVVFRDRKVFPENFILRHYIILSREHAINKYKTNRIYSKMEVEQRGWHTRRLNFSEEKLIFPNKNRLKFINESGWDKSDPWVRHEIFG